MMQNPVSINISYNNARLVGRFTRDPNVTSESAIWENLKARFINVPDTVIANEYIETPWPNILDTIRETGTKQFQQSFNFRLVPNESAKDKVLDFKNSLNELRKRNVAQGELISYQEIEDRLSHFGFTRTLRSFQLRDVQRLVSLSNGANFSVPGAGKTTVTLAVHLLTRQEGQHLFVVAPKAAFPAWRNIIDECMESSTDNDYNEQFTILDASELETDRLLKSGATRFVISYDLLIRQQTTISNYMVRRAVHLVLDESHRMKAGAASQRGAFLINIASLPLRRDILSGTPMPQSAQDIASQLRFLWPGSGLDLKIQRGESPRTVLGDMYVRTTKNELGLPPSKRWFYDIDMAPGQLALYGIVRNEALRQLSKAINYTNNSLAILNARKSVMRLLQLSANPILALQSMIADDLSIDSGIVDKVIEESTSQKMRAVIAHARELARTGNKVVIWTIFTGTILDLETQLADLNPVSLYGAIASGESDDTDTREGRIRRFHIDPQCNVLIANPAAAGEGISLHTVCHNAIYLDRSYTSTHFLQSIDRIHRLGLKPDVKTNIHIYRSRAPASLGSIDLSVSRRLADKIRNMQELLDDQDLHEIVLDEDNSADPTDYNIELKDLIDLVAELEGKSKDEEEA